MTSLLPKKKLATTHQTTVAAIAIDHLCFSYPDRPGVLDNVCLRITPGERVGIVGHNGCCK